MTTERSRHGAIDSATTLLFRVGGDLRPHGHKPTQKHGHKPVRAQSTPYPKNQGGGRWLLSHFGQFVNYPHIPHIKKWARADSSRPNTF